MAAEADIPDPMSLLKRDVEDKEMRSEVPNIPVSEGPKEEKKKIESWLSQPPEITDFFGKTETEEVGSDDEVENRNVINKGSVETVESDVFSKSLSAADEKSVRDTEHSQMTSHDEKSKTLAESEIMEKAAETIRPTIDMADEENKHGSSLLDAPVEETSQETEELTKEMKDSTSVEDELPHNNPGPSFFKKMKGYFFHKVDNLETSEEIETEGSSKEAETITNIEEQRPVGSPEEIVGEKQKDEAIIADDINKNEVQEANNLPTVDLDEKTRGAELEIPNKSGSEKQNEVSMSESGDHQEAIQFPKKEEKHVNETFEATENPESTISEHAATEGELNIEETLTSELKSEETLREINAEDKKEEEREQIEKAPDTQFFVERKSDFDGRSTIEETKDSTSVEDELPHKNPEPSFFKKMGDFFFHKVDNLDTSEEIEAEGSSKDAEMITNIEEQRPVGSPEEIVGEKQKDEAIIADDINKNEVQEANNLPTVDLDEKTRGAEVEIPNKSGSELGITHPPEEEEVQADRENQNGGVQADRENQNEVSMSESGDPQEAIRCPDKEEKHFKETVKATESPESTISTEGELNIEETSTSEMDINTEKGCELKSEETLKEINAEENMEEVREQIEKASDTEFLSERKSDDDRRSTIEEDIPIKKGSPLCSGEEEYRQDQEEQVRSSNSVPKELSGTVSGDQSYITSDEINTINEQIIHQEVCEDPKMAERAEDIKKEMENEENTITDFSPEPLGESTTKKHEAEASKGYDTYGEIMTLEESAITDLSSPDVREDKVEESLKEDRREAMIPDKEVWDSNIESREGDSEATHSTAESTTKDLKDEAEATEGLNAQSTMGSSEEETAQERDSNLVQSSSVPEIIEKEFNEELLEKEDSKDAVEATRLTAESEYPMAADSPNLISEEKGHVTNETSEMRSNDNDIIAESAGISILGDNEDVEIPAARKDGADESTEKTQPEDRNEICYELSKPEDQREISTVEASSEYKPEQEHLESSTMPLEAHNLVTGVSETTGVVLEKEKTLSEKEETPLVAETTEEYIAETEGDSTIQEIDTNIGSIDIGKERSIDDALVREPHPPLELDYGKSISESDVELSKGVNTGESANGSNTSELETSNNEKSSHVGVETDKSEFEEAVNEASQGVEVGVGCIETKNDILEQESPANNYEGSSKEGVEIEKATVEFESEAYDCGSVATEAQRISTQTEKKIDVEDRELSGELPNVTVNEVPLQEKENTESWLSQPPESIAIPETEGMQVAHNDEVGNVNFIDNVGTTEGESFLKSTSVADGELNENTEDNQLNTKEEMIGFQEEEGKGEMIADKNFIAEASYGQDEGVRIQTPELTGGSSRDVEVPNEVLHEGSMEKITSTEATSVEQDLKETSFEGEDKKSNALEMDPEVTQPSTDIGEEKSKGEEMQTATENELDEPTESNVGATEELGSSLVTEPDVCKNLEENSSMACKDDIQENGELVERMKEDASNEDEVEKQTLEPSFVKRAENIETSIEESETGMKDIDQETQKEAENQNKTLENEEEGPVGSSEEITGETIIAADIKEDDTREAKNLSMDDVGEKTRSAESNIPNNDVNEVYVTPRPVEEPEEDEKIRNEVSTEKENLGSPSIVALEEHETTPHDEHADSINKIEEERLVGKPEEIIGKQRSDKIMIADDSNNEEIPEAESLSAVDSDEKTRRAETEIPHNTREVCVTHPTMEETVLEGGEKKNEVSLSESVDQVHEASASEVPEDEEKHANDSYEASKSPDCSVSEHTCTEGELDTESTTSAKEIPAGSQEEIIWQPRKEESMIKIPEAENSSAVESYVTPPSKEETFLDKNDVSMLDQVHEKSEVPREDEEEKENESKDTYEATESPESNILEDTATDGAVNGEATSTRSAEDITLDKGGEPISEDEPKELKTEDNLEEEIEQKEKAADAEFQMLRISNDKETSTIKGESLVENNTRTCTREGEYHDQEGEGMSNKSIEASPALDCGEQSCSTSETTIIDDQIMNEEVHQDPEIADVGEDTDDLMKNEAHTVADLSPEPTGEHATMCPQENETEVLEKLPIAKGSANMGIQMKEEHIATKDNFDKSYGEETRNERSYGEEKDGKEPDTEASNAYGTAPASSTIVERAISNLPSSSIEEGKVEERLKEDTEDETKSEREVSNSHAEAFDAMHSTEQREDMALKHEAEANEDFNAESVTESSAEETTQKEWNEDLVENSSLVPETCEEGIKEEVLEKQNSNVPVLAEETSLTRVERENVEGLDSADLVSEEKGQVSTETSEMGSNATDVIDRTVETSIVGENNKTEIPTAREVATVETSLDDVSDKMLQASSIPTLEEQKLMSPEVGEATGEAPEKDKKKEKAETSLAEETTEYEIREIEDASSNPVKDTDFQSTDKEKESANDYAAVEDREITMPPEQNIEECTSESDVEVLRRVNTREVANPNEISKSEAIEELKSSEMDKSKYDTAISEASEGVETSGGFTDTEKAILEQEDSAEKLEVGSKESDEIENVPASEATSISTLQGENINIVEHEETATEPMFKDEDNRRFPETNPTNTEEEIHDENQTIALTDEQINRQDIEEGKKEMNEAMETKLETEEEIKGTQDAILTEKVSTEIESASEHETFKEQKMEEESCTKELHMLPAADGTVNEVPTVTESTSESEIIKEQTSEEESCTKELHDITAADQTVRETDLTAIHSLEAMASDKNAESNIAEDLNMESESPQKELNETEDEFSTGKVSTETSSAMDKVTYPDQAASRSLEATTEMMESKTAEDLNEESEASPMAEVLEDELKNMEKPVDVSSLVSEGSDEKMKGEKIEETEICGEETDIAPTVVPDLSSLGEVWLNDEPVKALEASSDAKSLQATKTAEAGKQELEETSIIESDQLPLHEHANADNANRHVEKSDANDVEVEATEIPDSVSLSKDQAVKEIHRTGSSPSVIEPDTKEIEKQTREVPEVSGRDDEITPGQTPQAEKTEEQLQVPSSGLLSEGQKSETTTGIGEVSTNKDAMEEANMRQSEVSLFREELETTSEGKGIENQVQGEENRVQDLSTVSSAEELDAESAKDNSIITKMSAQEVLETSHGSQDTDEPVKVHFTSSDTGSLQELDETSSMVSQFLVDEREKSESVRANVDKSDTYDVEEKELEIPGAVPEHTDQRVQDIQETGTSLPVGEAHTTETAYQTREVPEAFSQAIKQGVEPLSGDEIIAHVLATEVRSLDDLQLNEHMKALDTPSSAENLDAIKTADASQQEAEFKNMKLEETMVSQPPIHVHEEEDRENIPLEKLEANDVQVEETKISDTMPESEDQAGKEILETGTSRNVGDTDTNELEKPISEVPEALSEEMNRGVDAGRNDEINPSPILRSEKPEEQLDAPSSGLLSKEQKSETTTTDEKGITDRDDIEETKMLQNEIREELETTGEGKGIGNQVQGEEERAQDWSAVSSAEELDTKSSIDNAMITKMSTEEVLETDHGGHDTDEHVKALDTSSDIERLQTTQTPDASQQELEETSSMVSQLPVHVSEKAYNESVTEENSDACDVEVKEIDLRGVESESNDQRAKEIHEVGASFKDTRTKEMETQIREVCEALPEDVNQGGEPVGRDEIVSSAEAIEVTSFGELQLNDEQVEAPETNKTGDASQQHAEFDSIKHEETSILVSQLPIHEHEKEESTNIPVKKSDANDADVEGAEIPDTVAQSEDQAVKEIHETGTSLNEGGADTNETEKQISGVPEALSEPINPCFDKSRDDEMTHVQTLRAEKIEEELQVPSSTLLSKEEDGETSIEKGITDKDGTEVGRLEFQENSGSVLQLPVTKFNSANDVTEEKSEANEVELNETKALDVVSDSKDGVFEAIQEIRTIPAAEDTKTHKVEDEIREVTEKISDLRYKGVDAATDGENLDHPLPIDKLDEQIQLSSSSYESGKEEAAELDNSEFGKATDMSSKLPTTEHGIHHVGTTIEKSEADEVLVEEAKTSEAISESKGDVFEEFKEIGSTSPVTKICTDEVQEETKAVPETKFEPAYQGAQTATKVETAINQTLTPQGVEQLHEPTSTTEKPYLQDEVQRELEVSNLEPKVQKDSQISPDEENTGLEKGSTDAPLHYEERPVQQSSLEASTDEDIVYSKNLNKDADNLPTPYPTVTENPTEDIGEKYEEVSNLEFEESEEVLLESGSTINSPAVTLTSEGIEVVEGTPKESTSEEDAIGKYASAEKISEEMQGSRNFDQLSLQEETATKTNQEDESRAEDYPGEKTSMIFDSSRNEIQNEVLFKESEEDCVDKIMEGVTRADDKGPHQVSAPDEIANQSELGSHGDETDFTDTATEKTAQMEELKSSEAMLVSHEVERTGSDDEETAISKDGQLQNTDLVVPSVPNTVAEEALDGKELETFDDFSERALDPTHGIMERYEQKKEIATAGTINSESLVDNEELGHTFPKPGSEGSGGTENLDLTKKDGTNKPSFLSTTATSQETLADEESEKAVDTKQLHFKSNEPTAKPESIPEEGNGFQLQVQAMEKEPVEFSVMEDEAKLDENKIPTITAIEEESPQENDKPNVLPGIMDSEMELSRETVAMNISEDIQGLEKTSLAIAHEQIASKEDPSESIEHTNSKGMERGEEKRMDEQSEEITAQSEMTESAKMSLSDHLQRSTKRSMQGVEDVTEERELKRNKDEPQNETAETVEAEEEAVHDKKDEEEEGDELKREDSGSDAPVMVEASRDMDDKIAHKKAHHHNILSGVGSKVKHSLAKVKKAITGKSSHPKPTSPK